ncbi:MAG TPA: PTS sugar transporter subunit IIC [Gemmatimonadaceae bacterium]|nr:PTS sugar transporter subunit IIC [Gemmatimonadaceae bacterium]
MSAFEIFLLAVGGALIGLDVVSFPQAMISRPLVAATVGGAVLGAPAQGLLLGVVLELIALETLPIGASRYPEWGSASFVGGAMLVHFWPTITIPALVVISLLTVTVAYLGGWSMYVLRRLNGRLANRLLPALDAGSSSAIVRLQVMGVTADFLRGFLVSLAALLAVPPAMRAILQRWGASDLVALAVLCGLAIAVAMSAAWKSFHGTAHALWFFAAGLMVGLSLLVAL